MAPALSLNRATCPAHVSRRPARRRCPTPARATENNGGASDASAQAATDAVAKGFGKAGKGGAVPSAVKVRKRREKERDGAGALSTKAHRGLAALDADLIHLHPSLSL